MATISNPQAVRFVNEVVRPLANHWVSLYESVRRAKADWDTHGLSALIPNTPDLFADGSDVDGRPPVTAAFVRSLLDRMFELQTDLEATGNAKLDTIRRIANAGKPIF